MYLTENLKFHLAENLKFLREQNGKTQEELAVLFGIDQKTISSWECGSRKPPIGTIVSLAKLYRVSLDDLVLTDMRPPIPVYALNLAYLRRVICGAVALICVAFIVKRTIDFLKNKKS